MGYCTVGDVSSDFKNIEFSATSTVTDTEVGDFIDQESAFIDSMICSVYVVPVTGSSSLLLLKKIAIALVADRVRHVLYTKTGHGYIIFFTSLIALNLIAVGFAVYGAEKVMEVSTHNRKDRI